MKLSWRDIITTLLALAGGAIVYAVFYDYTWNLIDSLRSAVAILAVIGVAMFAFSDFDFSNRSILNVTEMILGLTVVGLAIAGMLITSEALFYITAATIGTVWLVDTARHVYHSMAHDTGYHHPAPTH